MIAVQVAESDADLDAWRRVRMAVLPGERAQTVDEMRSSRSTSSLFLLAALDGRLAGSGIADRSDLGGQGFLAPRVLPEMRQRGVGTALLRELAGHLERLGYDRAGTILDDPGSLVFVERFGFREVDRDVEQVRTVGDELWPKPPPGVEVVSLVERPELFERAYHELALEAFRDFALDRPIEISLDDWRRGWQVWVTRSVRIRVRGRLPLPG